MYLTSFVHLQPTNHIKSKNTHEFKVIKSKPLSKETDTNENKMRILTNSRYIMSCHTVLPQML